MTKICWIYDQKIEFEYLISVLYKISEGRYQRLKFNILPNRYKSELLQHTVTIPNINYGEVPTFWDRLRKSSHKSSNATNTYACDDINLINFIHSKVSSELNNPPDYTNLKMIVNLSEPTLIQLIIDKMEKYNVTIKSVNLYVSRWGPGASWYVTSIGKEISLHIYIRNTASIIDVASGIVGSTLEYVAQKHKTFLWKEYTAAKDFILMSKEINDLFVKYTGMPYSPFIKRINTHSSNKYSKSTAKFMENIGLNKQYHLRVDENTIYEGEQQLTMLRPNETKLLKKFIENAGKPITYDEINNEINNNENKFSLYAISKTIERLRKKLEYNHVPSSIIKTVRNTGYILVNQNQSHCLYSAHTKLNNN